MKFKVGDRVKIKKANLDSAWSRHHPGEIDTIVEIGDGYALLEEGLKAGHGGGVHLYEIKLVKENKMSKVTFLKLNDSITLHYNGKTKVVAKDDERFGRVLQAIRDNNLDSIPNIVELEKPLLQQGVEVDDGLVTVNGEAMPAELNARIVEYSKEKLPFESLKLFWDNLSQNPSFNSRKRLFKFLENKGHSITEDGHFIGYRGVTEDFKDRHTKKFDNKPGSVCEVPRTSVDDNPNNTCSYGLHVGGYEYAKDFGKDGKLVMVKVHPKDVVAVPNDYNGQKMRVCRFEVLREAEGILESPVVGSKGEKKSFPEIAKAIGKVITYSDAKVVVNGKEVTSFWEDAEALMKTARRVPNYANNHNKRDKFGKFASKKKSAKAAKRSRK
jgi:hypothetical protein